MFRKERPTSTNNVKHPVSISSSGSNPGSHHRQNVQKSDGRSASSKIVENKFYNDLKRYISYYNNGRYEVPELVKKIAGNDIITLEIATRDNRTLKIKAVTKKGFVKEFREVSTLRGTYSTVSVSSNESCIRALISSYDPMGKLATCLNSGDIDIKCKGFLKNAAVSALKNMG